MTRNPDRMAENVTKLIGVFADHASALITYSRGASGVGGIPATVGPMMSQMLDGEVIVASQFRDFIIGAALLIIDGALVTPRNGDRITEQSGKVYEVTAPKPMDCFEAMGPTGEAYRIHTKGPI